jgi:hypothetical protein
MDRKPSAAAAKSRARWPHSNVLKADIPMTARLEA